MKVLMVSKACAIAAYRQKLEELAARPDIELTLIVPPAWPVAGVPRPLERGHETGYELIVEPQFLPGRHHLHWYPGLGRHLDRLRPDLVHVDEEPYDFVTAHAVFAARRRRARTLFFTWQNLDRRFPPPFGWLERFTLRRADAAIAGNREAAEILRRKGFRRPLEVIPQFGVDPDRFRPTGRPPGPVRVGFAGRLVEEKGLLVLIRALAGLDGNWELHLIGDGPLRAPIQREAARLGIDDRVAFDGAVSSVEMPAQLAQLDVLVLPSLTRRHWKEQFGRVLAEAMACEVAVVGSDSGEIPNLIGDAGLIAREGDADDLRAKLADLLANPDRRADLGRRGRERVLGHFTQRRVAQETHQLYRTVLGEIPAKVAAR